MSAATGEAARAGTAARIRYNRIAAVYDLLDVFDERRFRPWRLELLARAAGRVLEIGIGTGKNFCCYPAGVSITGVDVAEKMLARASLQAGRRGVPIDLVLADVQDLPFGSDTFDTAVSTFVFCSVPRPLRGLGELRRVVKPEGRILMLEHMHEGRQAAAAPASLLGRLMERLLGPEIRNRMALAHVRQAGLEIESMKPGQGNGREWLIVARPAKAPLIGLRGAGVAA